MIKVGLTGGIGAGKSSVAKFFEDLGIPVYIADIEAKRLMQSSRVVKRKLINEFGKDAFIDNKLNTTYLAKIVFNNKDKLAAINKIVHPSVANSFKRWVRKQKAPYVIQENAILFESNSDKAFDVIVTVVAPLEERIKRIIARDNTSRAQVLARIKVQLSDKEKINRSDFVIENTTLQSSKNQVKKIHRRLLKLS